MADDSCGDGTVMATYAGRLANAAQVAEREQACYLDINDSLAQLDEIYRDLMYRCDITASAPGWTGPSAKAAAQYYLDLKEFFRASWTSNEKWNAAIQEIHAALDGAQFEYYHLPPAEVPQDIQAAAHAAQGRQVQVSEYDLGDYRLPTFTSLEEATNALFWERERQAKNALATMNHELDSARGKLEDAKQDAMVPSGHSAGRSWIDDPGSSDGSSTGGGDGAGGTGGVGAGSAGGATGSSHGIGYGSTTASGYGSAGGPLGSQSRMVARLNGSDEISAQARPSSIGANLIEHARAIEAANPNWPADYAGWPRYGYESTPEEIGQPGHQTTNTGHPAGWDRTTQADLDPDSATAFDPTTSAHTGLDGTLGTGPRAGTSQASGPHSTGSPGSSTFGTGAFGSSTGTTGTAGSTTGTAGSSTGVAGIGGTTAAGTTPTTTTAAGSGSTARTAAGGMGMMPMGGAGGGGGSNKRPQSRSEPYPPSGWEPAPESEEWIREQRKAELMRTAPWLVLPTGEAMDLIAAKQAEYDARIEAARQQQIQYAKDWYASRYPWQKGWWTRLGDNHIRGPKPPRPPQE